MLATTSEAAVMKPMRAGASCAVVAIKQMEVRSQQGAAAGTDVDATQPVKRISVSTRLCH
jgi:hypothetical protein